MKQIAEKEEVGNRGDAFRDQKMTEKSPPFRELNKRWIAAEKISVLKLAYNSQLEAILPDGSRKIGWIVAAELTEFEPVYTVESIEDNDPYFECPESRINPVDSKGPTKLTFRWFVPSFLENRSCYSLPQLLTSGIEWY